jgi:hypothetical protein
LNINRRSGVQRRGVVEQPETQQEVLRGIVSLSSQTNRQQAIKAGVSPSTFTHLFLGMRPSLETTLKIADALIPPEEQELRSRWFRATGHTDPYASRGDELVYESVFDGQTLDAFRGLRDFSAEDLVAVNEEMRRLIEAKRRKRGIG